MVIANRTVDRSQALADKFAGEGIHTSTMRLAGLTTGMSLNSTASGIISVIALQVSSNGASSARSRTSASST